jgi:hypothetical protein
MNKMTPHSPPLRVAILECDIPIGNTREKYGGYGNLFKELLLKGVDEVRDRDEKDFPELDVRKYNVVDEELYPELEDVDVVLLSGSREFHLLFYSNLILVLSVMMRRDGFSRLVDCARALS